VSIKPASSAPRARTAKNGEVNQEAIATQQAENDALISTWEKRARADGTAAFRATLRAHVEMTEGGSDTPDGAAAGALLMFTSKGDTEDAATVLFFLMEPVILDDLSPAIAASGSIGLMSTYTKAFEAAYHAAAKDFRAAPTVGDFLGEVAPEEARWRGRLYAYGAKALANTPATSPPYAPDKPRLVVFHYCVSLGIVSFKRTSGIKVIPPGRSRFLAGLPYTLISFYLGWWGIPWGPVWTLQAIGRNLGGGTDVTELVSGGGQPDGIAAPRKLKTNEELLGELMDQAALAAKGEAERRFRQDPGFVEGFVEAFAYGEVGASYDLGDDLLRPIQDAAAALSPRPDDKLRLVEEVSKAYIAGFCLGVSNAKKASSPGPGFFELMAELADAQRVIESMYADTMDEQRRRTLAVDFWRSTLKLGVSVRSLRPDMSWPTRTAQPSPPAGELLNPETPEGRAMLARVRAISRGDASPFGDRLT